MARAAATELLAPTARPAVEALPSVDEVPVSEAASERIAADLMGELASVTDEPVTDEPVTDEPGPGEPVSEAASERIAADLSCTPHGEATLSAAGALLPAPPLAAASLAEAGWVTMGLAGAPLSPPLGALRSAPPLSLPLSQRLSPAPSPMLSQLLAPQPPAKSCGSGGITGRRAR